MGDNRSFFILSGAISLSFFSIILSLFFYMMFTKTNTKTYALKKDNFVSISLNTPKEQTKQNNKKVVTPVEESKTVPEVKEVDVGSLFSSVPTQDISKTKKVVEKTEEKRKQELQKRPNPVVNNDVDKILQKINNIDAVVKSDDSTKTSSGEEVDEYLAKIQALVYEHFIPPKNSEGNTVKVVIELSAIGKVLDFRILNYSSSRALNEECDRMKERLMNIVFPVNPKNSSASTIINITSDKN